MNRQSGEPAFARLDDLPGVALLGAWVTFTAWLLAMHPGAVPPPQYWQALLGTAQIVFFAHLSRRLCGMRHRADDWRLLPEQCDRILAVLPSGIGVTTTEIDAAVDGASWHWAMDLLIKEGLAVQEKRDEYWRFQFATGAKKEWERLVSGVFIELSERDESRTLPQLASASMRKHGKHEHWLARAVYRLLRLGLIEQEEGDQAAYRLTRLGKDVDDATNRMLEFLPYNGSMSLVEIQHRLKAPERTARAAIEMMLMADFAEAMAVSRARAPRYRATWDPDAKYFARPPKQCGPPKLDPEKDDDKPGL